METLECTKKYLFTTEIPKNENLSFDGFLLNNQEHLSLQPCQNKISFFLVQKHESVIVARCTFFIENNHAQSPYRSSFGSIEMDEKLRFDVIDEFWKKTENVLKNKGVKTITIKSYPFCYHLKNSSLLSFLFSHNGFSLQTQELNYHIPVEESLFEKIIHENEGKKLKKAQRMGYVFEIAKNPDLKKTYEFIKKNRDKKNYPLTLEFSDFKKTIETFPADYQLFTVSLKKELAAMAVTIKINRNILYTFYAADDYSFRLDSPVVFLHHGIYNYCLEKKIKLIDLGIGSSKGCPNLSLIAFKEKIGGKPSLKLIFSKPL